MNDCQPRFATHIGLLVLILCAAFETQTSQAGTGQKTLLPMSKAVPKHGIRLAVDSHWVEGRGYRPIRIVVTATKASLADRTVSVSLRSNSWTAREFSMRVQQDLELPAGATSAKATIAIPSFEPWYQLSMDVLVDDAVANELSGPLPGFNQGNGWEAENPRIVVIGSGNKGLKEFGHVVDVFMAYSDTNYAAQQQALAQQRAMRQLQIGKQTFQAMLPTPTLTMSETTALIAAADLPDRWIDYSSLDIVYVSLSNLRSLSKQHPQTLRAIVDWVATGGNLWISGNGKEYKHLTVIQEACGLPPTKADGSDHPGWQTPEKDTKRWWSTNNGLNLRFDSEEAEEFESENDLEESTEESRVTSQPQPVIEAPDHLWREFALGRIVALADDQLPVSEPLPSGTLQRTVELLDIRRHLWTHRHGLSPAHENIAFWNFLIPGVGLAPVGAFRVLITVFVVIIGPVNFFFLRRWKRINLLLLTVPVSAALITGGLFAYALVHDGLGTRERVRSYVELDQRDGQLVAWARLSYYAGLTPSAGLKFPKDTVVLPLRVSESEQYGYGRSQVNRDIEWHDQQHLSEGWLKARTPTQYIIVRRAKTSAELKILKSDGPIKVTNRLGAKLLELILIDEGGSYHAASNVASDETVALRPVDKKYSSMIVRKQFQLNTPQLPGRMQQEYRGGVFDLNTNYNSPGNYSGYGGSFDYPSQNSSRLEQALVAIRVAGGPRESGSYIALLEHSPDIPLGLENVEEEASFHVIEGKW